MRFSPLALLVFVAFCVMLALSVSGGSSAFRAGEALVTVLIIVGLAGLTFRNRPRTR